MTYKETEIDLLRKRAGLPPLEYTTYYNLAGPHRLHAEGRVNMDTRFIIEMDQRGYEEILQNCHDQRVAYQKLLSLYKGKIKR